MLYKKLYNPLSQFSAPLVKVAVPLKDPGKRLQHLFQHPINFVEWQCLKLLLPSNQFIMLPHSFIFFDLFEFEYKVLVALTV